MGTETSRSPTPRRTSRLPLIPNSQNFSPLGVVDTGSGSSESRSAIVQPIFEGEDVGRPLSTFNDSLHRSFYGESSELMYGHQQCAPCRPNDFSDRYLHPTLTHNELRRLTMLWYHTRGINEDKELLRKLNNMSDMVQRLTNWEYSVIGIVDANVFVRIATKNLPLAILPRRDAPSSHTVTQTPGTVFQVPNLKDDWRFQNAPWTETGGLESYAGAQLKLRLDDGDNLAIGTLCIASSAPREALTDEQQQSLLRAAELVMAEIVTGTQLRRLNVRNQMGILLTELRSRDAAQNIESATIAAMHKLYPESRITIESLEEEEEAQTIPIGDDTRVLFSEVHAGVWEDTKYVEELVQNYRVAEKAPTRPIRAIFGRVPKSTKIIVLASTDLRFVFDDLDAWFIDQCAQNIGVAHQEQVLKEALATKNKFLRGITHHLRTPIHGVLTSTELLSEELRTGGGDRDEAREEILTAYLRLIRQSGMELMTTVNNMVRLNAWTENSPKSVQTLYDLLSLEEDVLEVVLAGYAEGALRNLSIRFENDFSEDTSVVKIDAFMLKELLTSLLQNAVRATPSGTIVVRTAIDTGNNILKFDVIDDGIGIDETDRVRIFQPFEKVETHTQGAGLGLTIASQIANTLGGTLLLVTSNKGAESGSHFRAVLTKFSPARRDASSRKEATRTDLSPAKYYIAHNSERSIHLVEHVDRYLKAKNWIKVEDAEGAIIITNQPQEDEKYVELVRQLTQPHLIIVVSDQALSGSTQVGLEEGSHDHLYWRVIGPLHNTRLDTIFTEANEGFDQHRRKLSSRSSLAHSIAELSAADMQKLSIQTPLATPCVQITSPDFLPPTPIKALLVDDNSVNLRVLQMYCRKRSIPYVDAVNGEEAVSRYSEALLKSEPITSNNATTDINTNSALPSTSGPEVPSLSQRRSINLILMDLQMPVCDGVKACQRIRSLEAARGLPRSVIFMLTGQDNIQDRRDSLAAGADEYFVKPVSLKRLDRVISSYIPAHAWSGSERRQ